MVDLARNALLGVLLRVLCHGTVLWVSQWKMALLRCPIGARRNRLPAMSVAVRLCVSAGVQRMGCYQNDGNDKIGQLA